MLISVYNFSLTAVQFHKINMFKNVPIQAYIRLFTIIC